MTGHVLVCFADDAHDYAARLVEHLTQAGLPVRTNVAVDADCAAFVPLLTPGASAADGVRSTVAAAVAAKRPFLTLLVVGERYESPTPLLFEDVRAGALPSDAFVKKLRELVFGKRRKPRVPRQRSKPKGDSSQPRPTRARAWFSVLAVALVAAVAIVAVTKWPSSPVAAPAPSTSPSPTSGPTSAAGAGPVVIGVDLHGESPAAAAQTMRALNSYLASAGRSTISLVAVNSTDSYVAAQCATAALQHTGNAAEVAVLGAYDQACTRLMLPALAAAGMLIVSGTNTAGSLTTNPGSTPVFARVVPTNAVRGRTDADRALILGMNDVLVLTETGNADSAEVAEAFNDEARARGIRSYPQTWDPAQPTAAFTVDGNITSVYLAGISGTETAALLTAKTRRLGSNTTSCLLASVDPALAPTFAASAGAAGAYVSTVGPPFSATLNPQDLDQVLALQVILAAIDASDGSRAGARAAVFTGKGISLSASTSVTGATITIDPRTGDVTPGGEITTSHVVNGALTALTGPWTLPASTASPSASASPGVAPCTAPPVIG